MHTETGTTTSISSQDKNEDETNMNDKNKVNTLVSRKVQEAYDRLYNGIDITNMFIY